MNACWNAYHNPALLRLMSHWLNIFLSHLQVRPESKPRLNKESFRPISRQQQDRFSNKLLCHLSCCFFATFLPLFCCLILPPFCHLFLPTFLGLLFGGLFWVGRTNVMLFWVCSTKVFCTSFFWGGSVKVFLRTACSWQKDQCHFFQGISKIRSIIEKCGNTVVMKLKKYEKMKIRSNPITSNIVIKRIAKH